MSIRQGLAGFAVAGVMLAGAGSALAASPRVVVSQVYGGGGNAGAPFTNDFVELYNRGTTAVSLDGWSIQYASATGTGNFGSATNVITPLSRDILPGQYVLVQEAAGAAGSALPTPDVTDATPINMAAGAGKVALVNTTTPLGCNGGSTPCSIAALSTIVDLVGYGNANFFEGSGTAPTLDNTTAALRRANGCADTDDNGVDFAKATPTPRNRLTPASPCSTGDAAPSVAATAPANGATNVALNANVSVTFSEPVTVTDPWYRIVCTTSGEHAAVASGSPTTFELDPTSDFVAGETCTFTVLAAGVSDVDTLDPPDRPLADFSWTVTTQQPPLRIHDIQGAGHVSPKAGQSVNGVPGIVTQKTSNGFFFQDPNPDSDPATSEALFAFGSISAGQVAVGDSVKVSGTVSEFLGSGSSSATNLPVTEIANTSVQVVSHGNQLPAPVLWSPPREVIEDDASGDLRTSGVFDPATDGIDYAESLEGMRVEIDDATATGPSVDFPSSQTTEVSLVGPGAGLRTPRGGIVIGASDFNPERLILQATLGAVPDVNVGDTIPGATLGVLDYNFGNYKLRPGGPVAFVSGGLQRETTAAATGDQLAVATFNVQNLDPSDGPAKFDGLAHVLVDNLRSPDIVALEEVQDDNGATDDGTVDSDTTLNLLVAAIEAAGGPTYRYRYVSPVDDQDGGEPGGNIRVAFLFRTDRGLAFVDRPGAGSLTPNAVVGSGADTHLQYTPGRVDPTSTAWNSSRKPLAGEFTYNGHRLFVIANHFNSKLGDQPLYGRFQPPGRSSETQRHNQAQEVHDFVGQLLAADPAANLVVLGDLNDFQFSDTLSILKGAGLHDLIETLPAGERYTYDFDGNSQAIDHILLAGNLFDHGDIRYDVVHVNSEFAVQTSDHDPQVVRATLARPTIAVSRTPAANADGWSNTDVTVTFACVDPLSALVACPAPVTVTSEGANQSVTGSSALKGGGTVSATLGGISIDETKPTVSYVGNAGTYGVDQVVHITCVAADALSEVASTTCADVNAPAASLDLGPHVLTASATDHAGNVGEGSTTFTVTVSAAGLCRLTQQYETKDAVAHSLCVKLDHGSIGAYANELHAQAGKSVTADQAELLIRLAEAL